MKTSIITVNRAELELELAQQAMSPGVVAAHYQLAEAYLERVAAADPAKRNAYA